MDMVRLAIVDMDERCMDNATRYLGTCNDIELIICESEPQIALDGIRRLKPDVVLIDPVLRGMDGISFLREINMLKDPPVAMCYSSFYSPILLESLRLNGAAFFVFKPVDFLSLHKAIIDCHLSNQRIQQIEKLSLEAVRDIAQHTLHIRNYIVSLGIPAKLIGCTYLAEAVRLAKQDGTLMKNLSKGLYLEIAQQLETTPVRIERSIRNAITVAYQHGTLRTRLPTCPSNKEMINMILRDMEN